MSELDDILANSFLHDQSLSKQQIKALMLELVLSADEKLKDTHTSTELVELNGRKSAILELCQKIKDL